MDAQLKFLPKSLMPPYYSFTPKEAAIKEISVDNDYCITFLPSSTRDLFCGTTRSSIAMHLAFLCYCLCRCKQPWFFHSSCLMLI